MMTRIIVAKLVWDDWNREHIKKHGVTENEIIKAGTNIIYHKRTYGGRYLAIGRSGTRLLSVVLRRERQKTYYLITARDASKKERRKVYAQEKQNS